MKARCGQDTRRAGRAWGRMEAASCGWPYFRRRITYTPARHARCVPIRAWSGDSCTGYPCELPHDHLVSQDGTMAEDVY